MDEFQESKIIKPDGLHGDGPSDQLEAETQCDNKVEAPKIGGQKIAITAAKAGEAKGAAVGPCRRDMPLPRRRQSRKSPQV